MVSALTTGEQSHILPLQWQIQSGYFPWEHQSKSQTHTSCQIDSLLLLFCAIVAVVQTCCAYSVPVSMLDTKYKSSCTRTTQKEKIFFVFTKCDDSSLDLDRYMAEVQKNVCEMKDITRPNTRVGQN